MQKLTPQGTLKIKNKKAILSKIFEKGSISRADLAIDLNTTKTTISKNVKELIDEDVLCEIGKGFNALGKKSILLNFKDDLFNYIFINLVGNSFIFYILNIRGEIIYKHSLPDLNKYDATSIVEENIKYINKNIKHAILSIPAIVQEDSVTSNIEIYKDLFLSLSFVCKSNNIHLSVINDIDLQTRFINKKYNDKKKNLIVIGANYGLGSSIIVNNNLYKGENNFAGEIGFLNPKLVNGKIQTLENRCSVGGIQEMYYKKTNLRLTIQELQDKINDNDKILASFINNMIEELAIVIHNLSYSFDIQLFYLYGTLFTLQSHIVIKIQDKLNVLSNRNIQINYLELVSCDIEVTRLFIKEDVLKLID